MTFQEIEIGGKIRPIRFSYAALYEYEKNTGRNAIADFSAIQGEAISVTVAADLIFAGLTLGAKSKGKTVDFTVYDVADWSFNDQAVITTAMAIFSESFPKTGTAPEDGDDEKKQIAKPGTT